MKLKLLTRKSDKYLFQIKLQLTNLNPFFFFFFKVNFCFMENYPNFNLTNGVVSNRIFFITNVTACILAKSRCSLYHPLSGEYQPQQQPQPGLAVSYYNSMQIAPNGDIKLVTFPYTTKVAELFCSNSMYGLEQAVYRNFMC